MSLEFTGTKSFVPRPKEGTTYRFACDPYSGIMHGSFKISWAATTEWRAPVSPLQSASRTRSVLRYLQQHECVPSRDGPSKTGGSPRCERASAAHTIARDNQIARAARG